MIGGADGREANTSRTRVARPARATPTGNSLQTAARPCARRKTCMYALGKLGFTMKRVSRRPGIRHPN